MDPFPIIPRGAAKRASGEAVGMAILRVLNERSHQNTRAMILDMAKYGNHGIEQHERDRFESTSDARSYLTDYDAELGDLVEGCRGKDERVRFFENLFDGGWTVDSAGDRLVC